MTTLYKMAHRRSLECVGASAPGLPRCWSQGADEAEAIQNLGRAILEYPAVASELRSV